MGMVVPTLGDRPEMLAECLDSLTRQAPTEPDILIVTTAAAVDRLVALAPGIPVTAQHGKGLAAAITTGFRAFGSAVDALGWLGDDDRLPDGSLRIALSELAARPGASMVYGRTRYISSSGEPLSLLCPGRFGQSMLRLGHNLILQPGCVYRRSAIEAIGGIDPTFPLAFDVDLHRRLIGHRRARYVPAVLGEARRHEGSLTVRHHAQSRAECEDCLVRHMPRWMRRSRPVWAPAAWQALRVAARLARR
jgi:GT2 family glycosyltransferase